MRFLSAGSCPLWIFAQSDLSHDAEHTAHGDWPVREDDPFSNFRSGSEIRNLRRCQRVLMRHHFNESELVGALLVKSTDFQYMINPETQLSFLSSTTVSGYRRDPNDAQHYLKRDLPPVTFKYSEFKRQEQRYQSVISKGRDLPSRSVDAPDFTVMDVFGNGFPDVFQDTGGGFYYWENLGQGRHPGGGNYKILDFCGSKKPNLLVEIDNNMGAPPVFSRRHQPNFTSKIRPGAPLGVPAFRFRYRCWRRPKSSITSAKSS